jgi:RNA polymerase sigma-70 factor (sigma-E family)
MKEAATDAPPTTDRLRLAFNRYGVALLRLCTLLTRRREDAEDLVQESFIRLAPKLEGLGEDMVWPYLRRIAINLWRNRLRRLALEIRVRERGDLDPRSMGSAFEDRDQVWAAVLDLPRRQRACVVLRYYEDLTERETAAVLGCSVGTVKSQTAKARARLEEVLGYGD